MVCILQLSYLAALASPPHLPTFTWYLTTLPWQELRWDTDVAEAVAAIKQQQQQSSADAHGGAAKQRGESFLSPNPSPRPNLNPNPLALALALALASTLTLARRVVFRRHRAPPQPRHLLRSQWARRRRHRRAQRRLR